MAEENFLDKVLGLISSAYNARRENRDELMQAILPEVLQPEELKQAAAKPLKEEASKSLHAPKYDRRMKFNTALERSQNQMTSEEPLVAKEEPAWLKEAVRKIAGDPAFDFSGVTGREGVVTVEDEFERTPPLPIEEPLEYEVGNKPVMQKESAIDLPVDSGIFSVAEPTASEKALPIVGGLSAGILPLTGAFFNPNPSLKSLGVAGLASAGFGLGTYGLLRHRQNKHREQAQKFVDRLNAVARSPMENFARTEIEKANKTAAYPDDTETFTQRNPWVLPVGVGLLGAAAGAIPAGLLGGRHAVKMLQKMHGSRRGVLEQELADAVRKSRNANKNWNLTQREFNDIKRMVPKKREALKNLEAPNLGMHETLGRAAGGALGGLTGGSLGVLGGLELNRPQPWEQ